MKTLEGQVAIVTGGARGIGKGICKLFSDHGATVVIWDVLDTGEDTAYELNLQGKNAEFQKVDVTNRESIRKAVVRIIQQYKTIDILINNAGILRDRSFLKMTDSEWHSVINVNLHGVFNCTKEVLPYMKEAGYGRIISASSVNGIRGAFGQTNYSASKAAIIAFSKSLAVEVGKYGITVNVVAPGFVKTAMTESMPKEMLDEVGKRIPIKRPGTIEEISHAYLYLASPQATYTTGHVLNVNGGIV